MAEVQIDGLTTWRTRTFDGLGQMLVRFLLLSPAALPASPPQRFKNFDAIRLVAASLVILSHSWMIAYAEDKTEPVNMLTGRILGTYCVSTFFIVSGMLVTESAVSRPGAVGFLWRRALRIVPGFVVCLAISFLTVAFLFSTVPPLTFLRTNLSSIVQHFLFLDGSGWLAHVQLYDVNAAHTEQEINGSVWTLQFEFICYIWLANFIAARWLNPAILIGIVAAFTYILASDNYGDFTTNLANAFPPFCSGVFAWYLSRMHKPRATIMAACVAAMALSIPLHILPYTFPILAAYVVLYLGVSAPFNVHFPKWIGDMSYGVYLWGWPVQQLVRRWQGPGSTALENAAASLPIALAMGYLSWHLLERQALKMKRLPLQDWLGRVEAGDGRPLPAAAPVSADA